MPWIFPREFSVSDDSLPDLTRTELRRIADEFRSERDAAKRDTMRAFDERNVALNQLATAEARIAQYREALEKLAVWYNVDARALCCKLCGNPWGKGEHHAPDCLLATKETT